jgi:CBS domain containing-hemolysin-like protein
MLLITSFILILLGISSSAVEVAVMFVEDIEKLKNSTASKIEQFKKNPRHFSFVAIYFKFLFFTLAFTFLGIWTKGELISILFVLLIGIISFYLIYEVRKFAERKPQIVLLIFKPLLLLIFLFFKVSFLLPEKLISMISSVDVNFIKHEFEFLIRNTGRDEAQDENQLLRNVFEFTDKTVREIMVPRTKVVALDINAPREKVIKIVLNEGYSRLPVYKDTIDNIIGIVYAKDLINYIEEPNLFVLHDLLRPAYFVPKTKKISELLKELQKNKIHIAIVVDEFGGFEGIVTLEDILEEIVGEIHDEYDKVEEEYKILNDGSIIVDAGMLVSDFNRKFNEDIPEDVDYGSLGGFVSKLAGRIPEEGEKIEFKNFVFEVLKKSKQRIVELKISRRT